jgi:hypothetical protein
MFPNPHHWPALRAKYSRSLFAASFHFQNASHTIAGARHAGLGDSTRLRFAVETQLNDCRCAGLSANLNEFGIAKMTTN